MKKKWTQIILLIILSSCSVLNNERIYEGSYKNDKITISFTDSKKGKLKINDNEIIPFEYEIESSRINPETKSINERKIKFYVYRFIVNADYELNFPLGFYEIGQKGGDILQGNDKLILVRKQN